MKQVEPITMNPPKAPRKTGRRHTGKPLSKLSDKYRNPSHWGQLLAKLATYLILISISYVFLYPLLNMLSMAFMSTADLINPEVDWIPQSPTLHNFSVASTVLQMPSAMINSFVVSGVFALAQTVVTTLTAFSFARYKFPFKNLLFTLMLLSFVIPAPVVLIPRLMIFTTAQSATGMQLIGTPIPQFLMALLGQGVYSAILILICYNFFKNIPLSLDEAAKIDGANPRQVFWHITIKISVSIILTVFLFSFVWNWNETQATSTFMRTGVDLLPRRLLIFDDIFSQRGADLQGQDGGQAMVNEAYKMAGTLISIAPLLVLYFFTQRQFIEGIENTGIK